MSYKNNSIVFSSAFLSGSDCLITDTNTRRHTQRPHNNRVWETAGSQCFQLLATSSFLLPHFFCLIPSSLFLVPHSLSPALSMCLPPAEQDAVKRYWDIRMPDIRSSKEKDLWRIWDLPAGATLGLPNLLVPRDHCVVPGLSFLAPRSSFIHKNWNLYPGEALNCCAALQGIFKVHRYGTKGSKLPDVVYSFRLLFFCSVLRPFISYSFALIQWNVLRLLPFVDDLARRSLLVAHFSHETETDAKQNRAECKPIKHFANPWDTDTPSQVS